MQHATAFDYLESDDVYLDAACQSLRPRPVLDAMNEYYLTYNSCGERVKHAWGTKVDEKVDAVREDLLNYLKLSPRQHVVSFTLNTTYGLNLILSQLKPDGIDKVITTDIEHNSVFLSTISFAERHGIERIVVNRNDDGSVPLEHDFTRALVVVNAVSNIDGRELTNINELIKKVHKAGGIVVIDAAQTLAHASHLLEKTAADALCFSAHKTYSASLGGIITKKSFLDKIQTSFIGGGMVEDVTEDSYELATHEPHTVFEPGLQAYGEIVAFGAALSWLREQKKAGYLSELHSLSQKLHDFLTEHPKVTLVNAQASPTLAFYHKDLDAHLLASALSDERIMTRSGYFCCHYYLKHSKQYPPLVRMSLGLHTTEQDIEKTIRVLGKVLA